MPEAGTLSFANCEQLVAELRKRDWQKNLREQNSKNLDLGPLTAIHRSVTKSTYRSFRGYGEWTPSLVFREWASTELIQGKFEELVRVRSQAQYHVWAIGMARSLAKEWQKKLRYSLDLARALKLINLLAKGLCIVSPLWPETYQKVVWHIEVPLDKYSLRPLSCVPELADIGIRWSVASMGSVKNLKTYCKIQESIFKVCKSAGVPPLAYDGLVWDAPHQNEH